MNRSTLTIMAGLLLAGAGMYAGCRTQPPGAPLKADTADLTPRQQTGEYVFMRYCNQCHPAGGAGVGPSLNSKPLLGFAIKAQVRNGAGAMPMFDEQTISDPNLTAVVDYLDRIRGQTRPW